MHISCAFPCGSRNIPQPMAMRRAFTDVFFATKGGAGSRSMTDILCIAVGSLAALAFVVSLMVFVRGERTVVVSLPARAPLPNDKVRNVADAYFGPTVRASSALTSPYFYQHDPAFAVDGRRRPSLIEKWASRPDDPRPWIEVLFPRPVHLQRVVLLHAGAFEPADYTADTYRLRCIRVGGKHADWLQVKGNTLAKTTHALDCSDASGVRVEFTPRPGGDHIVRLFEIEAFGQ
jgi:hypothetical protein